MQVKYFLYSIVALAFTVVFTGCFETAELSKDVGITAFGIPNQNGYLELQSRAFTVAEEPGEEYYEITNEKPFPFGALDDSLRFSFRTLNSNAVTTTIQVLDTNGVYVDSIIQVTSNSTILSFKTPVVLKVYAQDPEFTKEYRVSISEDTVNPDKVAWQTPGELAEIPFDPQGFYKAYSIGATVFVMYGMPNESAGILENKLFSSSDGLSWTEHPLTAGTFPAGIYHSFNSLKDKVYCFSSLQMNDVGEYVASDGVWSTTDGITWQKENTGLSLGGFAFHSINKLNGKLFAYGGTKVVDGQTELEKALYDTIYTDFEVTYKFPPQASFAIYEFDGTNWSQSSETTSLAMPARFMANSYAKGRIYIVNGESPADGLISTNTWATETGDYWLRTAYQSSDQLEGATLVNYNPYLWRIGGKNADGTLRGIMETVDDGYSWFDVDETIRPVAAPPATFMPRYDHVSVVDSQNRLWIIGGKTAEGGSNEVWIASKNIEL